MFRGFVLGIVVAIVVAAAAGYAVIVTGSVPAAADGKPLPLEHWAARTSLRATLTKEAPNGPNPVPLNDANLIAGIGLYSQHCAICHGTARGERSPVAKGEYPAPPQLAKDGVEDDPEGWTYLEDRQRHSLDRHAVLEGHAEHPADVATGVVPEAHGQAATRRATGMGAGEVK